jgi:hypothetical protein
MWWFGPDIYSRPNLQVSGSPPSHIDKQAYTKSTQKVRHEVTSNIILVAWYLTLCVQ